MATEDITTTASIDAAKKGIIGDALNSIVPVTEDTAHFEGYYNRRVQPLLSLTDMLMFSSKEQALALKALVEFEYPGSNLLLEDNIGFYSYPPIRRLVYTNEGGMFDPRIYKVTGTINLNGVQVPTEFNVGYCINVKRIMLRGSSPWTLNAPPTRTGLAAINEFGMAQPEWVGKL